MELENFTSALPPSTAETSDTWYFSGIEVFQAGSAFSAVINVIAFVFIYRCRSSFGNNGFWEQLLILCSNDALTSCFLFLFTFLQSGPPGPVRYFSGLAFIYFQLNSFGNTLGISLQRFISIRKAGELQVTWTRKYTFIFFATNCLSILIFLVIYLLLRTVVSVEMSNLVFIIIISSSVLVTDTLCCLTLYYLKKNLQSVGGIWTSTARGQGATSVYRSELSSCTMVNNNPKLGMQRVHELKPDFKMQHVNAWEEKPSFEKPSLSDLSEQITDPVYQLELDTETTQPVHPATPGPSNDGVSHPSSSKSDPAVPTIQTTPMTTAKPSSQHLSRFGRYQRDAGLTVAIVVCLLNLFTFVPVLVSILTRINPDAANLDTYRSIIMCMAVNTLLNPFVYVFRMNSLRAKVMRHVRTLCRRR